MSGDYWYPWYPSLFKAATRHLTPEQDGIYRRLIDEYMETREPLPDSDIALARIAGCNEIKWLDAKRIVIAYFTHKNGMYFHKKCDELLDIQDKKSKRRSLSAEKAAKKRWEKTETNQRVTCDTHAERNTVAMRGDATVTDTVTVTDINSINNNTLVELDFCFDVYNQLANKIGLSTVQIRSEKRKNGLKARLKEAGGIEGWRKALQNVEESDFLSGKKTDWKADFDFIITKNKFISIMEGKYQNGKKHTKSAAIDNELQDYLDRKRP